MGLIWISFRAFSASIGVLRIVDLGFSSRALRAAGPSPQAFKYRAFGPAVPLVSLRGKPAKFQIKRTKSQTCTFSPGTPLSRAASAGLPPCRYLKFGACDFANFCHPSGVVLWWGRSFTQGCTLPRLRRWCMTSTPELRCWLLPPSAGDGINSAG